MSSRNLILQNLHGLRPPKSDGVRGRFAPSPTGQLHLGNARTALLAWLQVRSQGGSFVLRMEDLDPARSHPDQAAEILTDLRWLGLDWDEGPGEAGPFAPYLQSLRAPLYREALADLAARGVAFRCYCSRAEVARAATAPHGAGSDGPRYPGTCRHLPFATELERVRAGRQAAWRFRVSGGPVAFVDGIAGPVSQDVAAQVGDFVIWRADGVASYQLAVVVDDIAMGITDVLRGDDLIDSTPRQVLIYRALGAAPPRFHHVPLLVGPDGRRLSKRHGSVAVAALRADGAAPEAVVGYLAALSGLVPLGTRTRAQDLISLWDPGRIPREPVAVNPDDLERLLPS